MLPNASRPLSKKDEDEEAVEASGLVSEGLWDEEEGERRLDLCSGLVLEGGGLSSKEMNFIALLISCIAAASTAVSIASRTAMPPPLRVPFLVAALSGVT
jgi:hypothetical protein